MQERGKIRMVIVGKTDQFEHLYMEKFRGFAAHFGQFVEYKRDIATRDIGLHLTQPLKSGAAKLTTCLCWFQMKGIMKKTLPKKDAENAKSFSYRLKVEHLRFWFLLPMPTYLALYVESLDKFFILNLQKYVEKTWGKEILTLKQKTAEVTIPSGSILDDEALGLILRKSTFEAWSKAMSADENEVRLCQRDYNIIWSIGTASKRKVEHRFEIFDWQSKTRGEVHIEERRKGTDEEWKVLRNHWQLGLQATDVEDMYPYLDFTPEEEAEEPDEELDADAFLSHVIFGETQFDGPTFRMKNGQYAAGEDVYGEYHVYYLIPELNELGESLFSLIQTLIKIKFIEISETEGEFMSVAPWHARQV